MSLALVLEVPLRPFCLAEWGREAINGIMSRKYICVCSVLMEVA